MELPGNFRGGGGGGGGGRGVLFICTRPIVPRSVALAPLAESLDQANLAVVTQLS